MRGKMIDKVLRYIEVLNDDDDNDGIYRKLIVILIH